jgi:hypothetical protein
MSALPRPNSPNPGSIVDVTYQVAPGEVLTETFDFSTRPLNAGEALTTVASSTVTTFSRNAQSTLTVASTSITGTVLTFSLSGQIAPASYLVEILVNTTTSGAPNQVRAAMVEVICVGT